MMHLGCGKGQKCMTLYTVGYGKWSVAVRATSLISALRAHEIQVLVDIRHSPCASDLNPASIGPYRMQDWHLQAEDNGIERLLRHAGIDYLWVVELGNPQKKDPDMKVLRAHLRSADDRWPVNRGLDLLKRLVVDQGKRCCLLCACAEVQSCHRKLVTDEISNSRAAAFGGIEIRHL